MKKAAIFLTAMVVSLSLVACGGRNNSGSTQQSSSGSYQEGYDKGYRDGYQEGKKETGSIGAENGGVHNGSANTDGGSAIGNAVGDVGNAVGDAVAGVGDAVGDALGGSNAAGDTARSAGRSRSADSTMGDSRTRGTTGTFQRMLDNARVTDTDGIIR